MVYLTPKNKIIGGYFMYLVFSERTGAIVAKSTDMAKASRIAIQRTEEHEWTDRDTFDVRVA